jgi:cytochrome c oxidase assembly factor CtaG
MLAHQVVAPSELAGAWSFEPGVVAALAGTAVVYARGTARLGRRVGPFGRARRDAAFYGGLLVIAAALLSPLDALAAALFSAHMVQHLVLMVVAAPLLAAARPAAALVAGLPARGRDMARRARADLRPWTEHWLGNPLVVWTVGTVALWAWHMPSLYEAALAHDGLHALEHASFLGTALLFWGVVFASGARRGVPRPVATLLVFASGVQSSALGAILLFASTPLYPVHNAGAVVWGRSPLEDQQLAGALMWVPPGLLYVLTMAWLLVRWFADMDRAAASSDRLLVGAGEGL